MDPIEAPEGQSLAFSNFQKRLVRSHGSQVVAEGELRSTPRARTEPETPNALGCGELAQPEALSPPRHAAIGDAALNGTEDAPQAVYSADEDGLWLEDPAELWCGLEDGDEDMDVKLSEESLLEILESLPGPVPEPLPESRRDRFPEDHENNVRHDYFEYTSPCAGIERSQRVRLASGQSKLAADVEEGDLLLDPYGNPLSMESISYVSGKGCKFTRNSRAQTNDIYGRQSVIVGASNLLAASVRQKDLQPYDIVRNDGRSPKMRIEYRELAESTVVEANGTRRRIVKAHKNSASVSYNALPAPKVTVSTREEAEEQAVCKAYEKVPQRDGEPEPLIKWYPEARDMVKYRPAKDVLNTDNRIAANVTAINLDRAVWASIQVPTGVVSQSPAVGLSPERLAFERAARHLSPGQLEIFWYLAGAWVGDGTMTTLNIAVDSADKESMLRFSEDAAALGLYCDLDYSFLPEKELAENWGQVGKKLARVHLCGPAGTSDLEAGKFGRMLEFTTRQARLAQEWRDKRAEHRRQLKEQGKQAPESEVCPHMRGAVAIILFNGYKNGRRIITDKNWLWGLFLKAQVRGTAVRDGRQTYIKTGPEWLITSPVEWREAFLAGLTESDGHKNGICKRYDICTIYPELCDLVIAVARSLGITVFVTCRPAKVFKWGSQEIHQQPAYIASLTGGRALRTTMLRVASPRKKPDALWPDPDSNEENQLASYAVTPLHGEFDFVQFKVRGHAFLLENGLVCLDAYAKGQFTETGWPAAAKKPQQLPDKEQCISCRTTEILRWRPSWNFREGWLCHPCGLLFRKFMAHCTVCNHIPIEKEWKAIKAQAKPGEDGKLRFPCPKCSKHDSEQLTVVQDDKDETHECYSCQTTKSVRWFRSWRPTEGVLCDKCCGGFKLSKMYCKTCRLVPKMKKILSVEPDAQGLKTYPCPRCMAPFTLQLDPCYSCGKFNKVMKKHPDIPEVLCRTCYDHFRSTNVCCQKCKYIPGQRELSQDPQFASTSTCRGCRSTGS